NLNVKIWAPCLVYDHQSGFRIRSLIMDGQRPPLGIRRYRSCGKSACKDHMDDRGFACQKCAPSRKGPRGSKGPGEPGGVMG
ncbi:MAG: hypothetical protein ACMUHY_09365, partial [Thermoplasmatota archaeon]